MINLCAKFEVSGYTCSKDMMGPKNFKRGHMTLTMPIWIWGVLSSQANGWYGICSYMHGTCWAQHLPCYHSVMHWKP